MDLVELHTVTGIITQGAGLQSELDWVVSYRLAYWSIRSTNVSEIWLYYQDIEGNQNVNICFYFFSEMYNARRYTDV